MAAPTVRRHVLGRAVALRPIPRPPARRPPPRRRPPRRRPLVLLRRSLRRRIPLRRGRHEIPGWVVVAVVVGVLLLAGRGVAEVAAPPTPAGPDVGGRVTTAAHVLDLADDQIGTTEARNGGTPYHESYGLPDDQPWCAVFVWDLFQRASGGDSIGPKTAYTPTMASWFQARNQWTDVPAVGALVFFNWPDSKDRIQHVGIVEFFDGSTITAIEGNTSGTSAGSQDNGDGVYRRTRPRNGSIVGYGLPIYGSQS
jgi:hypothetical protein